MQKNPTDFLPLTETTYLILCSLGKPLHGYGITQNVSTITNGRIILVPGTLYGALKKLTKDKLIEVAKSDPMETKKKNYVLTPLGKDVIELESKRLESLLEESRQLLRGEF